MAAAARVMNRPTEGAEPPLRQLMRTIVPDGRERTLEDTELIVSKTDLSGRITYANSVFLKIAVLEEREALGAPHSLIRHPEMPRCVFKLLWDRIAAGHEVFAYVNNLARDGANYWVFAHVTPTYDRGGRIVGYHSNRRRPDRGAVEKAAALYRDLCAVERGAGSKAEACARGLARLTDQLDAARTDYDAFVFSL